MRAMLYVLVGGLAACATTSASKGSNMKPPIAERRPHTTELHGETLVDDYFWLRDREDPKVIAYLEGENAYTQSKMQHTKALQKKLFDEMLGRIKEDDNSVPYKEGDYWYYTRTESGKPYGIHCRKKGSLEAAEEILLDGNLLAEGKEFMRVGSMAVSPDHGMLAYGVDFNGSERYTLHFKDLRTGEVLEESVSDVYYSLAWGNDNRTVFYTTVDETTRPHKIWRHALGTNAKDDVVVLHEPDDSYFASVTRTRSDRYLLIELESAVTTEVHILDADRPQDDFQVVQPRMQGVEYYVAHHRDRFFVRTNDGAENFKLMQTPVSSPGKGSWSELIAHREGVTLSGMDVFADHLVLYEREEGLPQIRIRKLSDDTEHLVEFEDPAYDVWADENPEFGTTTLRFVYTSLVRPATTYDYDMNTRARALKKEKEVPGYDRDAYVTDRIWATAADGTRVPISIVHRKDFTRDGQAPMLLYGYGSYGYSYDAGFNANVLSLVDRGFVSGIAHVRGGGEMGRRWKNDGKFEKKMNTFTDFVACADHLVANKYTSPSRLAISGRSAGGLLMGAVTNLRPDLFGAVIAGVPFVDVVNTMVDATIPLTVTEWEEWGNPNEKKYYDVIKAYSPYDNVKEAAYPNMLITAGLNDPRVQYWEPAKWTARLRQNKTTDSWLLLKTDMGAGHGGQSGRYGRLEDRAFEYAFILDRLGVVD